MDVDERSKTTPLQLPGIARSKFRFALAEGRLSSCERKSQSFLEGSFSAFRRAPFPREKPPSRCFPGRCEGDGNALETRLDTAADLRFQLRPAKNFAAIMPRPGRNEDYAIRQLSRVTCRRLMHTCMKRLSAGRVIISIMISIINAGGGWFTALSSIINADLSPPRDDNATLVARAAASAVLHPRSCPSLFRSSLRKAGAFTARTGVDRKCRSSSR